MAPELRSHPLQLRSWKQYQSVQSSPVVRYGVGVCVGITAFKWLKHNVRKVPVVGPVIADVMPAMLLGAVAGVATVYGVQKVHETEVSFLEKSNDVDVHQLLDEAGAGFQQMLGAAGNAVNDAATTVQAAVVAAATVAERELEYVQRTSASANDVEREVAHFMYKMQPQRYDYHHVFEQTKRKLQQQKRHREHQW